MNRFRKPLKIGLITLGLILVCYFMLRNIILHAVFNRVAGKLKEEYKSSVSVDEISFTGLAGIRIRNLSVVPEDQDTLLKIDSLYARPSLFPLLIGKIKLKEVDMANASFFISCHDSVCNYQSFVRHKKNETVKNVTEINYASFLNVWISRAFDLAPQLADFRNINISYSGNEKSDLINIPFFISSDREVKGFCINLGDSSQWNITGNFSQRKRMFDFKLFPEGKKKSNLPILESLYSARCRFDTLHGALNEYRCSGGQVKLRGQISADNFFVQQDKISDRPVGVSRADFDFTVIVGKNSIELDTSSVILVNKLLIRPYLNYTSGLSKTYSVSLHTDKIPANDFFNSLPAGMFDETDGVEADGNLQYSLNFLLDSAQPDSLVFGSVMKKEKFRLTKSGKENLLKMNGEFLHSVYERGIFVRSFVVGPSNPDFTPLGQISQYFKNAVMTSEDGSFFYHSGFNEDAFRKSIAANYKAGKFVRGGSTITMQLVKNVFLTRNKTVARKAEEALIVWLLESNRLCSKERMFEVYLNIIELGPGVYGIGEASRFYFNKKPSELSLAESVFLASLLPRPKWFKYSFDELGNLKPYLADYYRVVANFLLKKNLITQNEYDQLQPRVELRGPAKNSVIPVDSLPGIEEEPEE